jgi:hypothetical protein
VLVIKAPAALGIGPIYFVDERADTRMLREHVADMHIDTDSGAVGD